MLRAKQQTNEKDNVGAYLVNIDAQLLAKDTNTHFCPAFFLLISSHPSVFSPPAHIEGQPKAHKLYRWLVTYSVTCMSTHVFIQCWNNYTHITETVFYCFLIFILSFLLCFFCYRHIVNCPCGTAIYTQLYSKVWHVKHLLPDSNCEAMITGYSYLYSFNSELSHLKLYIK